MPKLTEKNKKDASKYTIIKDRIEIYSDFTENLLSYVFDYYLGKDTLYLDSDINNYFMFCYNKVCDEFLDEDIDFSNNKELIKYFHMYYYHQFFTVEDDKTEQQIKNFWKSIFDVDRLTNKSSLKVLVEIYVIFDKSITPPKNILELS